MFRLEAPYNSTRQITILPDPDLDDEESFDIVTLVRKSMNDKIYSYNSRPSTNEQRLTFTWDTAARGKILEVIEFIELYGGGFIRVIDHKSRIWKTILQTNPTVFSINSRAVPVGFNESGSFTLIFFGKQVGTEV